MKNTLEKKYFAKKLRLSGFSLKEISKQLHIAKSTASLWLSNVELPPSAQKKLLLKITRGQMVAAEKKKLTTKNLLNAYAAHARNEISRNPFLTQHRRILCSLLYICEGAKTFSSGLRFTNSDPQLIKLFLSLLRSSYNLDERKFRVCLHLHPYHDPNTEILFWSRITSIPPSQFIKPYLKQNGGKYKKEGYRGCTTVYYHSNDLAKRVLMMGMTFLSEYAKN